MRFSRIILKIEKICIDKSLLSLSIFDSKVSVELPESQSELKSELEVAELLRDSDFEVLHTEFGILMAKYVNFWTPYCTPVSLLLSFSEVYGL